MASDREDPTKKKRKHERTDLSLLVQYRFNTFEDFMAEYAVNLSPGGMFLHTETPQEVGSMIYMQFSLKDGSKLIEGLGRVVRVIHPGSGKATPGMAIEFTQFDEESEAFIRQICEGKGKRGP
jgi:molecular chaperone DnaK